MRNILSQALKKGARSAGSSEDGAASSLWPSSGSSRFNYRFNTSLIIQMSASRRQRYLLILQSLRGEAGQRHSNKILFIHLSFQISCSRFSSSTELSTFNLWVPELEIWRRCYIGTDMQWTWTCRKCILLLFIVPMPIRRSDAHIHYILLSIIHITS